MCIEAKFFAPFAIAKCYAKYLVQAKFAGTYDLNVISRGEGGWCSSMDTVT